MNTFTIGWLAWILWFLIEEGVALFNKRSGDTLSEHVWKWFAISQPNNPHGSPSGLIRLRRVLLLGFMAWLSVHFLGGGKLV